MSEHTQEPWTAIPAGDHENDSATAEIIDGFGRTATVYGDEGQDMANARRIVACVNALAGIPTEDLETAAAFPTAAGRLNYLEAAVGHRLRIGENP